MTKQSSKISKSFLVALAFVLIASAMPVDVWAQAGADTLGGLAQTFSTNQLSAFTKVFIAVLFFAGLAVGFSGILGMKKYAEKPAQESIMKHVVATLIGAALMSAWPITSYVQKTAGFTGTSGATYTASTVTF